MKSCYLVKGGWKDWYYIVFMSYGWACDAPPLYRFVLIKKLFKKEVVWDITVINSYSIIEYHNGVNCKVASEKKSYQEINQEFE